MDNNYLQILSIAKQNFAANVFDSFGQRIVQEFFDSSLESMGKLSFLEEENSNKVLEIQSTLEQTKEIGLSTRTGFDKI